MGVSLELWRARIGCFVMPRKCRTRVETVKPVFVSLAIRLALFYLLIAEGIESNPGPHSRTTDAGSEQGSSPRGRGRGRGARGNGGRGGRGSRRGRGETVDIFANAAVGGIPGQEAQPEPPYSLRRSSRSQNQPTVSDWLMGSQSQSQSQSMLHTNNPQRDIDLESQTSEQQSEPTETDDIDATGTTSLLPEIRRDVKAMNKKFDYLEKSVRTLKHDSKCLKEQNSRLTNQVTELQSTVSQLESRTRETEQKNERLEAQSRRDNLKFHGFDDNRRETWEESENTVRRYISEELNIDDSAIKIVWAHRIRSRNSPRPIIVKFSHYKDRDSVLKSFREKRRSRLADNAQGLVGENRNGNDGAEVPESRNNIRVSEDFPERVVKVRSELYPFLKSSIEQGHDAFFRYDHLVVDGQEYEYDSVRRRPVPVSK